MKKKSLIIVIHMEHCIIHELTITALYHQAGHSMHHSPPTNFLLFLIASIPGVYFFSHIQWCIQMPKLETLLY